MKGCFLRLKRYSTFYVAYRRICLIAEVVTRIEALHLHQGLHVSSRPGLHSTESARRSLPGNPKSASSCAPKSLEHCAGYAGAAPT